MSRNGKEEEEFKSNDFERKRFLCNANYVPEDFVELYNDLKLFFWKEKLKKYLGDFEEEE